MTSLWCRVFLFLFLQSKIVGKLQSSSGVPATVVVLCEDALRSLQLFASVLSKHLSQILQVLEG